ncbi:threonine/serine exporter family protein [Phaeovibrio sulfidiphilus]|uniref:Threonine/serine exporter family protein n=1 Tax=Phaeovibrio sulfidiphilus TaxID=1220600 RepID=A0A8J6YWN8_9PROT|nr:threonine/serine exporter family protein [Phaeovibrio sulfidiphilus]MBE1236053.1 threonine/serine exporter family protein [Phaeovibrio sulfidiphilus]
MTSGPSDPTGPSGPAPGGAPAATSGGAPAHGDDAFRAVCASGLPVSGSEASDTTILTHRALEAINHAALRIGQILAQSGAHTAVVRENVTAIARSMGADGVDLRVGYASLTLTLRHDRNSITRMTAVGPQGVNQRLEDSLRALVRRVLDGEDLTPVALLAEIDRIERETRRYPLWVTSLAVGAACAAFCVLLQGDLATVLAVLPVATAAQAIRAVLKRRHFNDYLSILLLAFTSCLGATLLASLFGSATPGTAMIGPTLLLVPGVPAINGLADVLEGRPTLGAARLTVVAMVIVFLAIGVWNAAFLLEADAFLGTWMAPVEQGAPAP